ncbi:YqzH family protein [Alkalihalobacterium bogoriense]|uniref:YqzH family protein n=1 Tax=Alkalihalobacterium bogoriense TaxID=246272 RepID=UPI00047C1E45|nr:YqzH family protein [Alkalihalobacterium bogoriense]
MDKEFLYKKIKQITESYIQDEFISISEIELQQLLNTIYKKVEQGESEDLYEIIHDVIYEWLTT